MGRKAILNMTSTKKRNTMLTISNTLDTGASAPLAIRPAYITSAGGKFLWCATAMDLTDGSGNYASPAQAAVRTSTSCYMRGLSETLRIQTSSGIPWFHRRICFTNKGVAPFIVRSTADTSSNVPATPYIDSANGVQRLWLNQTVNGTPNTINDREGVIFKGANGLDWNDPIVAPVDTARVTVKFDKTWTYKSGNERGTVFEKKLWHPMNKTLVYDDDESGDRETTNYISTDSKAGMGDYYVLDIIQPGTGVAANDAVLIQCTSTLYWHER